MLLFISWAKSNQTNKLQQCLQRREKKMKVDENGQFAALNDKCFPFCNSFLNDLIRLWTPKSKDNKLFFSNHTNTNFVFKHFFNNLCWFSSIFLDYSCQCFRVERFCIMSVQGKQRKSYSIWCLCDPLGLALPYSFFYSKSSAQFTHQHLIRGAGQNRLTQFISKMDGRSQATTNEGCYRTNKAEFSYLCEYFSAFL